MSSTKDNDHGHHIHTQGGSYVEGGVHTDGGDFVARDKVIGGDVVYGNKVSITITGLFQRISTPSPEQQLENRARMLAKVQRIWIVGLLEWSVERQARIELELVERPDAVHIPFNAEVQELNQPPRKVARNTPITKVFDDLGSTLLILGAPGAGKTTLLLELARELITRAMDDERQPIPVIFNLSSWAARQLPLAVWMVDEMNTKYEVPRSVGTSWVKSNALLPLLDGLDEVRQDKRDACVQAINNYRQEHGLVPLAVCSRDADYEMITARLRLDGAIIVQPLTKEQVDGYLARAGDAGSRLRSAFQSDAALWELATSPLMLRIMVLAYDGMSSTAFPAGGSLEERRRHLFGVYVDRMFQRRGTTADYTANQTILWLAWLARKMVQSDQSQFYIEQLQPSWLSLRTMRIYYSALVGLIGGLPWGIAAATGTLLHALVPWLVAYGQRPLIVIMIPIAIALEFALGALLFWLHGVTAQAALRLTRLPSRVIGMQVAVGLQEWQITKCRAADTTRLQHIRPVLKVGLSWRLGFLALIGGGIIGVVGALANEGLQEWINRQFVERGSEQSFVFPEFVAEVLEWGLPVGVALALLFGMQVGYVDEKNLSHQGIRRSLQNATQVGTIVAMVFGVTLGLISGFSYGLAQAVAWGSATWLAIGGFAGVQHYVLRFMLWRSGAIPWKYATFLDHASERILLRKIGGGYIFVHRLLMEYFASLDDQKSSSA